MNFFLKIIFVIIVAFGLFLGYQIAFPEKALVNKPKSSLIDDGKDPDVLGINPNDMKYSQELADKSAEKIASNIAKFILEKQKELNEGNCIDIFLDSDKNGAYDSLFLGKYNIQDIAPKDLVIRYDTCSFLWYKNKRIVLSLTTQTLLNNDVQDVGIKYVPSFVYTFEIDGNSPENLKLKLIQKDSGLLPIDKFLIP
jgi:hypothetical protein